MPKYPDAHQVTEEEVRDVVADREHRMGRSSEPGTELYPVSKWDIVESVLGSDPSWQQYRGHGFGPSRESYVNPQLSMTTLANVLNALTEQGVLAKVKKPPQKYRPPADEVRLIRAVRFHGTVSGWVLAESLDEAYERVDAQERDRQRAKLRNSAEQTIVVRYIEEVGSEYRALCAGAGLDPEIELPVVKKSWEDED